MNVAALELAVPLAELAAAPPAALRLQLGANSAPSGGRRALPQLIQGK